jgi:hypothetical protein
MPTLGQALLGTDAAAGLAVDLDGQVQGAGRQHAAGEEGLAIPARVRVREAVAQAARYLGVVGVAQQGVQVIRAPGAQLETVTL